MAFGCGTTPGPARFAIAVRSAFSFPSWASSSRSFEASASDQHRSDADLPAVAQRVELAEAAKTAAEAALNERKGEPALRAYSLCAVVVAASYRPSSSCRMQAERIRATLFPRSPKP